MNKSIIKEIARKIKDGLLSIFLLSGAGIYLFWAYGQLADKFGF